MSVQLISPCLSSADYTFRDWFVLRYAEQLHSDPGLWRLTLHYLHYAGESGISVLRRLVLHIPYADPTTPNDTKGKGKEIVEAEQQGETTVHDVIRACYEYGLSTEAEIICKVGALSDHCGARTAHFIVRLA